MSGKASKQEDPVNEDTGEKKRGRPRGSTKKTPILTSSEILGPSFPFSKPQSTSPKRSPKRAKSAINVRADASIDLAYLRSCDPSVRLKTPEEAVREALITLNPLSLYEKLYEVPLGCIPIELKVRLLISYNSFW